MGVLVAGVQRKVQTLWFCFSALKRIQHLRKIRMTVILASGLDHLPSLSLYLSLCLFLSLSLCLSPSISLSLSLFVSVSVSVCVCVCCVCVLCIVCVCIHVPKEKTLRFLLSVLFISEGQMWFWLRESHTWKQTFWIYLFVCLFVLWKQLVFSKLPWDRSIQSFAYPIICKRLLDMGILWSLQCSSPEGPGRIPQRIPQNFFVFLGIMLSRPWEGTCCFQGIYEQRVFGRRPRTEEPFWNKQKGNSETMFCQFPSHPSPSQAPLASAEQKVLLPSQPSAHNLALTAQKFLISVVHISQACIPSLYVAGQLRNGLSV